MAQQLHGSRVVFTSERQVALQDFSLDAALGPRRSAGPRQIQRHQSGDGREPATPVWCSRWLPCASIVRPGDSRPEPYPRPTGYGHLGAVLAVGSAVEGIQVGDTVTSFAHHASLAKVDTGHFCLPVPAALGPRRPARRLCANGRRRHHRCPQRQRLPRRQSVLVVGLGLVGNFAAQLFRLAGAEVLASDPIDERRAIAAQCGIARTVNPVTDNLAAAVLDWTAGHGVDIAVEAIGRSELIAEAVELTRRHGELILLGSPRAHHTMNVTPMLTRIHLQGITLRGALEWLYPIPDTPGLKHSITRNYRQLLEWMAADRLIVDPLRTHVLSPAQCAEAYAGLANQQDRYLGVLFDWTGTASA